MRVVSLLMVSTGSFGSALAYCAAWVSGNGCIPINNLMEDAATAEISRVQLWEWVYHSTIHVRSFFSRSHNSIMPLHSLPLYLLGYW